MVDLVGVGLNATDTLIPLADYPARGSKVEFRGATVMPGGQTATTVVYWGKGMYPQAIEEWKTFARLDGDPNNVEFAAALDEGYKAGGWKEALKRGIAVRLAQRKNSYASPYLLAQLYAQAGDKEQAFYWLDTAYRERDLRVSAEYRFSARSRPLRSALRRAGEEGGLAARFAIAFGGSSVVYYATQRCPWAWQ